MPSTVWSQPQQNILPVNKLPRHHLQRGDPHSWQLSFSLCTARRATSNISNSLRWLREKTPKSLSRLTTDDLATQRIYFYFNAKGSLRAPSTMKLQEKKRKEKMKSTENTENTNVYPAIGLLIRRQIGWQVRLSIMSQCQIIIIFGRWGSDNVKPWL